jgi:hypothetical protein
MARAKVKLNSGAMEALLKSGQVREPLAVIADRWAAAARASAPVASGAYRDGIGRDSTTTDRAVERVVAHDKDSAVIEARTGNLKRAMGR